MTPTMPRTNEPTERARFVDAIRAILKVKPEAVKEPARKHPPKAKPRKKP